MPLDTQLAAIPRLKGDENLAPLGKPARMWVVGSLYGRYGALCQLHDMLANRLRPRDRVIYLGNYLGEHSHWTGEGPALIDELIAFRNSVIAIPGFFTHDITFLHGRGEDVLRQALHLPFQKNPHVWLAHARQCGLEWYTSIYGGEHIDELAMLGVAQSGLIGMNKWTHLIRQTIASHAGHSEFFKELKTAAYTQYGKNKQDMCCVPAGLHPHYSLNLQHDLLCWPEEDIHALTDYKPFARIVRGQALQKTIPEQNNFVLTLDDGAMLDGGMDGVVYAACLNPQGKILDWFEF